MATIDDFEKLDIRVGLIVHAQDFPEAKIPSFRLTIDFGPQIGIKSSAVRTTHHYTKAELLGKKVLSIINLPPKQIGPFLSEVDTLVVPDENNHTILVVPEKIEAAIGGKLF